MFLLGQIKNKCVIGLGQGKNLGKHKCLSSHVICKLWLLEHICLGKEKEFLLTCDSVSPSLLSARDAKGQHAHPLISWAALVVHLHMALVPIPPTVLVACRRKRG